MQQVNLGMIGGGTVGSGVFHALQLNGGLMASRISVRVNLRKVAVKAFDEPRPYAIPASRMTTDWQSVVADPQVDVVAELVGGTTLARTMILVALKLGKPVITANKALLSAHGEELFAAAQQYGTNLYYEASVCGGIPIIKALREGLVGNRITHLYGIVNGTCNYILTRMKMEGADFDTVLKDAQAQGYAEAEPSLDIDGHDALHKIGILASLAHGFWVNPKDIYVEGIRSITRMDIQFANQLGYTIKLLGIIKKIESRGARGPRTATLDLLDDPQQLDRVAELVRKLNVHPRNRADAFDIDVLGVDPEAVRQGGQNADLVQRVVAIDVERRLGLGVPLRLGVLEDGVKVGPLHLHAGEDEDGGAVDDAVEVGDAVTDKALAQGFDNGNAAANAGL